MIFGFDLDGCVINFQPVLLEVAKELYGIKYENDEMVEWGLELDSPEKEDKVVEVALKRWTDYKPYPGALEFIEEYYKKTWNIVYFITSRHDTVEEETTNWINSYLDSHVAYELVHAENKVYEANKRDITHFVEDKAETVEKLLEDGLEVFMPNRAWNRKYENEMVIRFDEWSEIEKWVQPLFRTYGKAI